MDDDFIPYGYVACRCGEWMLQGRKLCDECLADIGKSADEALVIDVDGKAVRVSRPPIRKKRKPKKSERSRYDRTMEDRARDRARTRAWIRLAHIYEPMFVAIYTEEQLREGIEPVTPPPMQGDAFDGLARDLAEFRERQEATFVAEQSSLPGEAPSATPA